MLDLYEPPRPDTESITPSLDSGSTARSDRVSSPTLSSDSTCFSPSVISLASTDQHNQQQKQFHHSKSSSFLSNIKSLLTGEPTRKSSIRITNKSKHSNFPRGYLLKTNVETLTSQANLDSLFPIVDGLSHSMKASMLDSNSATMLPSLIETLPSGKEKGKFLSVDVGGSTLRIALIELFGRASGIHPQVVGSETFPINQATKSLQGSEFFGWIACHIKALLERLNVSNEHTCMGLSWSFPFAQLECVSRGTILTMGKGYHVADEIAGWDLRTAFEQSFTDLGLDITLTAVVNDTVASLLSHAYMNPSTRAAVIVGTGFNSSALVSRDGNSKLINTEVSLMGGDGILPQTEWDQYLDKRVERPGFQPFETMVSGRYMGEVARLVILNLHSAGCIVLHPISHNSSQILSTPYAFETPLMAQVEGLYYLDQQVKKAKRVFEQGTKVTLSDTDFDKVAGVLRAISTRSANWIAASLVALVQNMGNDDLPRESSQTVTIAYSGTVIEKYPGFKEKCQDTLQRLGSRCMQGGQPKLVLEGMLDGTLFGPAIASAMYA